MHTIMIGTVVGTKSKLLYPTPTAVSQWNFDFKNETHTFEVLCITWPYAPGVQTIVTGEFTSTSK